MSALNPAHSATARLGAASTKPTSAPRVPQAVVPAALPSQDLFQGQKTVTIEHNGTVYRLQNTRAGKLILTK
jgi:hemin uptake protein HemP